MNSKYSEKDSNSNHIDSTEKYMYINIMQIHHIIAQNSSNARGKHIGKTKPKSIKQLKKIKN